MSAAVVTSCSAAWNLTYEEGYSVIKELEVLLRVQADDAEIRRIAERGDVFEEREESLEQERAAVHAAVERAAAALEREASKRQALQDKVAQHRLLHQRNVAQLDQVRRLREATAAETQIEMARHILAEEERELHAMDGRIEQLRQAHAAHEAEVAEAEERQEGARSELAADRAELAAELGAASDKRDGEASEIPRKLLSSYERIRDRRQGAALFPVRGLSCGNCDTAIPLQRRNIMADGATIEVCEGCGVLLYATLE